jgi:hypothetical protein
LHLDQTNELRYNNQGWTPLLPLGYLRDLDPKFKAKSKQAFVLVGFIRQPNSKIPEIVLKITESANSLDSPDSQICLNWREVAHSGTPLHRVLTRLEKKLTETQPEQASYPTDKRSCFAWLRCFSKSRRPSKNPVGEARLPKSQKQTVNSVIGITA